MSEADRGGSPLEALCQQVAALTLAVQRLQEGYVQLDGRLQHLTAAPPAANPSPPTTGASASSSQGNANPPVALPPPEPRVPMPERFRGDRRQFRAFKNACQLYLALQPRTFASEPVKVGFIISLLSGEPQTWAHNLLEQKNPALNSVEAFFESMSHLYDDPQRTATAEAALHVLVQGRRPVEDYTIDFRRWSSDTGWNESALKYQYRHGLSEVLKDELARVETPATLEALIQLATKLDRRLRERRSERFQSARPTWVTPKVPPVHFPAPVPSSSGNPEEEPMQLGLVRGPLTAEERLRRRQANLCLYCGASGHFLRNCPIRPSKSAYLFRSNFQETGSSLAHFALSVSLQIAEEEVQVPAILDSGACSCFLDASLAQKLNIPLFFKRQVLNIYLADGSSPCSGPVTQETGPILTKTNTNHQEFLRFDVIHSPLFPIILGHPWLQAHNPQIDWVKRQVSFSSPYCLQHCLTPATPQPASCSTIQVSTESLQHVPLAYQDFRDLFDKKQADRLPPHRPYDCPIELLPGSEIPFGRIFPLSETELEALRSYINENLEKGFLRPSSSPAGAGIFFVEKKDGTLRPCVDYRELNKITVKNRYPLPLIPELFQRFRMARLFTKLDLRGAYNLIRIREGDEWKTAFRSRFGHFEYLVMPFGLCNAPATFQHFVNDIFREYLDHFVIVYLDDILIFSTTLELHQSHVRKVLSTLRTHGLFIKAEKCEFEKTTIQFLGLIISTTGIAMDPQKIQAILDWPVPLDKKGIQRFIGFANFYRRFIKGFSAIIAPISQLTRQQVRFQWSQEAQTAFDKLKNLFISAPILQHPDPALPYVLEVDASEVATGAILSQRQGPKALLHPVAFASRKMTSPERNYDVGDRELLAIKFALEEWRYLLEGASYPILIFTDHKNLEYLRTAKRLRPRQARWALFFSRFCFHISYRPGSKNGKADALSRMFPEAPETTEPGTILSPQNFCLIQSNLKAVISQAYGQCPESELSSLMEQDGFFFFQGKVFVPQQARLQVLRALHDHKLAGHFGIQKTTEMVQRSFWWPKWRQECREYVNSCTVCIRNKGSNIRSWGLLRPLPIPERPWKRISMDFIVELPPSEGFSTIFVTVDRLSKMAHFIPMVGTPSAVQTAKVFIKEVVKLHGLPDDITSDRGVQFTSKFWKELCKSLSIEICLSSAYHPQSNGQTERTNQTLEQYLRCFCTFSQDDWVSLLPCAEFAYNNSMHSATSQTPFWANYGFHPSFLPNIIPESVVPAVQDRIKFLQTNFQHLQEAIREAQERYKKYYDQGRKENPIFKIGEEVWLSTVNLKLSCPSRKLGPRFIGPFKIKKVINPVAFELSLPSSYRVHPVFHVSLLKSAILNPFPGRLAPPPPPVLVEGEKEFEVEAILDCRRRRRQIQYLVKWKGYPPEENSWEPSGNIHAPQLLQAFQRRFPDKMARLGIRRLPLGGGHCQGPTVRLPVRLRNRMALRRTQTRASAIQRARGRAGMALLHSQIHNSTAHTGLH